EIAACKIFRIKIRYGAVPKSKAFVMLAGEHNVLGTHVLCQARPFLCKILLWPEQGAQELRIFVSGNTRLVLDPLDTARILFAIPNTRSRAIESPMDEHAQPSFPPPAHPFVMLRLGFGGVHL